MLQPHSSLHAHLAHDAMSTHLTIWLLSQCLIHFPHGSSGKKYLSALDVARLTSVERAGGGTEERSHHAVHYAKAGRNQLREILRANPDIVPEPVDDNVERRAAQRLTQNDLQAIAAGIAELDEEDDFEATQKALLEEEEGYMSDAHIYTVNHII